jgi:hypothetical protein
MIRVLAHEQKVGDDDSPLLAQGAGLKLAFAADASQFCEA